VVVVSVGGWCSVGGEKKSPSKTMIFFLRERKSQKKRITIFHQIFIYFHQYLFSMIGRVQEARGRSPSVPDLAWYNISIILGRASCSAGFVLKWIIAHKHSYGTHTPGGK
jgi:hypothetical protein